MAKLSVHGSTVLASVKRWKVIDDHEFTTYLRYMSDKVILIKRKSPNYTSGWKVLYATGNLCKLTPEAWLQARLDNGWTKE